MNISLTRNSKLSHADVRDGVVDFVGNKKKIMYIHIYIYK